MRVIIWVITVQQFAGGLWERGEYLGFKKEIRRQLQIEIFLLSNFVHFEYEYENRCNTEWSTICTKGVIVYTLS